MADPNTLLQFDAPGAGTWEQDPVHFPRPMTHYFQATHTPAAISRKGVHVADCGPGDHFGEIALIDGGPRTATVTATTEMVCYGLTFWEFRPLVERNGAIGWKLLQALAKRLRTAES